MANNTELLIALAQALGVELPTTVQTTAIVYWK